MSESSIRAALANLIETALTVGGDVPKVHAAALRLTSEEDVTAALDSGTTDSEGRTVLRGWVVFPGTLTSEPATAMVGYRTQRYTFSIVGYRSMVSGEESNMEADVDTIEAAILAPTAFSSLTPRPWPTRVDYTIGPARIGGAQVWEATLTIQLTAYAPRVVGE